MITHCGSIGKFIPREADAFITSDGERLAWRVRGELYPMDLKKITLGEMVIYDKDSPGPPWFLLEMDCGKEFIPANANRFITADGDVLRCLSRYRKTKRGV